MDWKEIEVLHEKYMQGETTRAEENRLQVLLTENYEQLPDDYKSTAAYFKYVQYMQKQQSSTTEADLKRIAVEQNSSGGIRRLLYTRGWSIAAGLALLLSLTVFFYMLEQPEPETPVYAKVIVIDDEEEALKTLLEALALMSANIRIGQEAVISGMTQFDEANPFKQQQKKD